MTKPNKVLKMNIFISIFVTTVHMTETNNVHGNSLLNSETIVLVTKLYGSHNEDDSPTAYCLITKFTAHTLLLATLSWLACKLILLL